MDQVEFHMKPRICWVFFEVCLGTFEIYMRLDDKPAFQWKERGGRNRSRGSGVD